MSSTSQILSSASCILILALSLAVKTAFFGILYIQNLFDTF